MLSGYILCIVFLHCATARSFQVDRNKGVFLLDNQTFTYVAGCLHYFRVPRPYWRQRLKLMRAAGVNVLQTPVEWSSHERSEGNFDFHGDNDVVEFINIAQQEDLYVILQAGPFIGAERDFGGLPPWLLWKYPGIKLRTNDPNYLRRVEIYLTEVFRRIKPLLIVNSGPILMLEIESERIDHLSRLKDIYKQHLGQDVILLTVDSGKGRSYPPSRHTYFRSSIFSTPYNWETDTRVLHYTPHVVNPYGPRINTELEMGLTAIWGFPWKRLTAQRMSGMLERILVERGGNNLTSTGLSMFHGGTNFGFTSGALYLPRTGRYVPCTTSYDSDAPIDEAGGVTYKFYEIRDFITRFFNAPAVPNNTNPSAHYGDVQMFGTACLLETYTLARTIATSEHPLSFEDLHQGYGLVIYETELQADYDSAHLHLPNLRDRAQVYLDRQLIGILSRSDWKTGLDLKDLRKGSVLQIVVENQGRVYPDPMDKNQLYYKGVSFTLHGVLLGSHSLYNWTMYGFPLDDAEEIHAFVEALPGRQHRWPFCTPTLFKGTFQLPGDTKKPVDTHLSMAGWGKGVVWVNGRNLGRYWPEEGPQMTLYLPGCFLLAPPGVNKLVILELEHPRAGHNVTLKAETIIWSALPLSTNAAVAFCMLCAVVTAMICSMWRTSHWIYSM